MDFNETFTTTEAAKKLGISYNTIVKLMNEGKLKYFCAGKRRKITDTMIQEYIDKSVKENLRKANNRLVITDNNDNIFKSRLERKPMKMPTRRII